MKLMRLSASKRTATCRTTRHQEGTLGMNGDQVEKKEKGADNMLIGVATWPLPWICWTCVKSRKESFIDNERQDSGRCGRCISLSVRVVKTAKMARLSALSKLHRTLNRRGFGRMAEKRQASFVVCPSWVDASSICQCTRANCLNRPFDHVPTKIASQSFSESEGNG